MNLRTVNILMASHRAERVVGPLEKVPAEAALAALRILLLVA